MITNYDLYEIADKLKIPLVGIFSKDKLPLKRDRNDGGYIVNLQDDLDIQGNPNEGSHWVAFYISKGRASYFDPFGIIMPRQVQEYLSDLKPCYSTKEIQNIQSSICGYYCIYFLYWMSRNPQIKSLSERLEKFVNLFDKNPLKNKAILEKLLKPL